VVRDTGRSNLPGIVLSLAIAVAGPSVAPFAFASASNPIILVSPRDLPALARQDGEAMFLRDSADGRRLLYVEQRKGTQLAIFDVTDPSRVRSEGLVQLHAPGPFYLVADLGKRGELVRFRGGQGDALLDLRMIPSLKKVPGLVARNSIIFVADDDARFSRQSIDPPLGQGARDYKIFQSSESPGDDRVLDVPQVRQEMTNADTGTTFLLAADGLYLIRRPALEATPAEVNDK
jgi:hypothetical protein